jgi:hypothetical protein
MPNESKKMFSNFLANKTFKGMNERYRYGMMAGCDIECPVLQRGECELKDLDNKELYQEYLTINNLENE